ncbi:MAG TPA: hypothetical protein VK832_03775, partial [Burkholderiaceae bacterium]|nr:hypothetical protein [Burkholderiaceae bacterium]
MYAIAFAMLCAMLTSFYVVTAEEQQVAAYQSTAADVAAANFWSYWLVVGQYNHQNPGLAGPVTVADGNLQWQMG